MLNYLFYISLSQIVEKLLLCQLLLCCFVKMKKLDLKSFCFKVMMQIFSLIGQDVSLAWKKSSLVDTNLLFPYYSVAPLT